MPNLLSIIVARWKENFTGTSALEIADVLKVSHDEAIYRLQVLESEGSVRLNKCQLGQGTKFNEFSMGGTSVKIATEWEMVDTLMAFPNQSVLENAFHQDRVEYGVFTKRLHLGASQVRHYYFKRDVLDEYVKYDDRYKVEEDSVGGSVSMTTKYYMSFPETDRDALTFANVRFGRMKLADGTEAIAAIAKDLDGLPIQDQHHWAAHEISSPVPSPADRSFADYISEQFEGNWRIDHTDYIKVLSEVLNSLNKRDGQMFRKTAHPGLHVPVLNTHGEYIAAHKELYKLVGADNLVQDTLKAALRAAGCADVDFMNDGRRPKGTWALLRMLAERNGLDWSAFEIVASNRQLDSHQIQTGPAGGEYYPARFRDDLQKLILELRKLA